jgi:hypothetical protein
MADSGPASKRPEEDDKKLVFIDKRERQIALDNEQERRLINCNRKCTAGSIPLYHWRTPRLRITEPALCWDDEATSLFCFDFAVLALFS